MRHLDVALFSLSHNAGHKVMYFNVGLVHLHSVLIFTTFFDIFFSSFPCSLTLLHVGSTSLFSKFSEISMFFLARLGTPSGHLDLTRSISYKVND